MLKVGVLMLILFKLVHANFSPVLLWGATCSEKPSLKIVDKDEFAKCVRMLLESHMLIVFLENTLSTKDFTCNGCDNQSSCCFTHLKYVKPKSFYAQVEKPYEVLKSLDINFSENTLNVNGRMKENIHCGIGSIQILQFTDPLLPRHRKLRRHDTFMQRLEKNLNVMCNVSFMYMASQSDERKGRRGQNDLRTPLHQRYRRQDNRKKTQDEKRITLYKYYFGISFSKVHIYQGSPTADFLTLDEIGDVKIEGGSLNATIILNNSKSMEWIFVTTSHDYTLKEVKFDDVSYDVPYVTCSRADSFACYRAKMTNKKTGNLLVFQDLQFQVAKTNSTKKFSDKLDCNSLFSITTLMVTMICGLLVTILLIGISFMMDIKTNDRMDNPDGPRLLFKAAEG